MSRYRPAFDAWRIGSAALTLGGTVNFLSDPGFLALVARLQRARPEIGFLEERNYRKPLRLGGARFLFCLATGCRLRSGTFRRARQPIREVNEVQ